MQTPEDKVDATIADDLLEGADAIAKFLFGDIQKSRRVYHLASGAKGANKLPVFRLGSMICARRSTLLQWVARQEGGAAAKKPEAA